MPKRRRREAAAPVSQGRVMLYGINSVRAALEAERRELYRLHQRTGRVPQKLQSIAHLAGQLRLPISERNGAELERLCGAPDHQGIVLECGSLPVGSEGECLGAARQGSPLLLALDQVEDPRNFGAVVRCCALFGIDGVVVSRRHSSPFSPAATKASAGYLETFPVFVVANLARFLSQCRKQGYWVAAAEEQGEIPLNDFKRDRPLVVLMGNEGRGLRPLVRRECDIGISIRTAVPGSLNVAAAAAVVLYQLTLPG